MRTRNGKIARLPREIREELNQRLERSEPSPALLAWLNALPAARDMARQDFGGRPIDKHNLSEWRLGGYQEWLTRHDLFADARNADEFMAMQEEPGKRVLADDVATVLTAHYAGLLGRWDGKCTGEFEVKARVLGGICDGVVRLQREAHQARFDARQIRPAAPVEAPAAQNLSTFFDSNEIHPSDGAGGNPA